MNHVVGNWLAMIFSLGSRKPFEMLSIVFMFLLAPLSLIDPLLSRHPSAQNIAHGIYVIAKRDA
jgi:hypothetical protein